MAEGETVEQVLDTKPQRPKPRLFKSECYMVAIDHLWFLAKDDWTEFPTFGKKYSRAKMADADADAERVRHPGKMIRVVKAMQTIRIYELDAL